MIDSIAKLGGWGGLGLLVGIALTIWIQPTSTAGIALVVVVSIVASTAIGSLISAVMGRRQDKNG